MSTPVMVFVSELIKRVCPVPEEIEFYEVDNQILFPRKTVDENAIDDYIVYLVKKGDHNTGKGFYKYGISLRELFKQPVTDFVKYLENNKAVTIEEVNKLDHPLVK